MTKLLSAAAKPLSGAVEFPGDKSLAHRALILGTISSGVLEVENLPRGRDVFSTRKCLEHLGARIDGRGGRLVVEGLGLRGLSSPSRALDCGNSGTTMRLLMGLLAGQDGKAELFGDASLTGRPMRRAAEPLELMGAAFSLSSGGRPPVSLAGRHPLSPIDYALPLPSAQVKSAVLLAGLYADGRTRIRDPFKTRDHTERMLRFLGAGDALRVEEDGASIEPALLHSDKVLRLPGDPSSAAYFAAAAALIPGSELMLRGILLNPSRMGFFETLKSMGLPLQAVMREEAGGEPVGDMQINSAPLSGVRVPRETTPSLIDEAPLLAVVAAKARGETRIEGLGELRHKESDRLSATKDALAAMGADARVDGDDLVVRGPARLRGARIETRGDHRIAMAFSIAALLAEGETSLDDSACVAVSFPDFFEKLEALAL